MQNDNPNMEERPEHGNLPGQSIESDPAQNISPPEGTYGGRDGDFAPNDSSDEANPASTPSSVTPNAMGNTGARPIERTRNNEERSRSEGGRNRARGTAAMDPSTRQEVARKGGQAVSRNKQHMAEIGRKGGQTVSKNRDHMAVIGRKGGEASRGTR